MDNRAAGKDLGPRIPLKITCVHKPSSSAVLDLRYLGQLWNHRPGQFRIKSLRELGGLLLRDT